MHNIHTKKKTGIVFNLPEELSATTAPELRGVNRDRVKLLVADREKRQTFHSTFNHLPDFLRKGDLLVFNSSRTLPASLNTLEDKKHSITEVRLAEHLPDDSWLVLLLNEKKSGSGNNIYPGLKIEFETGLTAIVEKRDSYNPRLWKVRFSQTGADLINIFYQIGQPIRYGYVSAPLPLEYYLTVFAKDPGSSEMPSAGRAFTWKMFFELKNKGIDTAFLTLHTGLSSYMDDNLTRTPRVGEEEYFIPAGTVGKIQTAKADRGRIIAVGTTVVRALESAAACSGRIIPGHAYTTLRITEGHVLKVANGLITGFHEPEASHLDLISAFLNPEEIRKIYAEAIKRKYLWHEFGDLSLIL
jgi:S-adenosylmethionine:tRNA ribosyltransferase-isomerase